MMGNLITETREARKLTQHQLAYLAELSPVTLTRLEQGRRVQRASLNRVCRVLGIDPNQIEIEIFNPWHARKK